MSKFRFHLSSGQFITVECDRVKLERADDGSYKSYTVEGVPGNKFLSFSIPDLIAVEEV